MSSYTDQRGTAGLAPGQEKTDRGPQRRRRQGGGQLTAQVRDATVTAAYFSAGDCYVFQYV